MRKYYLSHPFETYGDRDENIRKEEELFRFLWTSYDLEVKYIRPFVLVPRDLDREAAMRECFKLLRECDGIILAPNWNRSDGCVAEFNLAQKLGLEIVEIIDTSMGIKS